MIKIGKKIRKLKIKITTAVKLVNKSVSVFRVAGIAGTGFVRAIVSAKSRMAHILT